MKTSELIQTLASILVMTEKEVRGYAKHLRDNGLLSKNRGRYYPDVTSTDAANLVVAIMGAENAHRGPAAVENYEVFRDFIAEELDQSDFDTVPFEEVEYIMIDRRINWARIQHHGGGARLIPGINSEEPIAAVTGLQLNATLKAVQLYPLWAHLHAKHLD